MFEIHSGQPATSARACRALPVAVLATGLWIAGAALASAQTGGSYALWASVDHGGGRSLGGAYYLAGTAGQADAGERLGGNYRLLGGFQVALSPPGGVGVALPAPPLPRLVLHAPAPNPLETAGSIAFELPDATPTRLRVFDVRGGLVSALVDARLEAGRHVAHLDRHMTDRLGSGVYFIRLEHGGVSLTRKLVIAR